MTQIDFVKLVRKHAGTSAVDSVVSLLTEPPGRCPDPELLEDSKWFNSLEQSQRQFVLRALRRGVFHALFDFLCILDGSQAIEVPGQKGQLELYYVKNALRILLNDPHSPPLHEFLDPI